MNIHEYQAKELLRQAGLPVARGFMAHTAIEAEFAMRRLGCDKVVVKAQVHAGGRGKAGGVKLANNFDECALFTQNMLGMNLVTKQTGPQGKMVRKVYVEEASKITKEFYLALLVDRETAGISIVASTEGGMDIEEVAEKTPDKIITVSVDPTVGLKPFHKRLLSFGLNLSPELTRQCHAILDKFYQQFTALDASMIEINPLVVTTDNQLLVLDCKMAFDDNALWRHPDIENLRDFFEEDIRDIEASKYGLNYIGLDGNIGCLVNGAGLAMATMDIIKLHGGKPANFLDVGGGASEEMVRNAFSILLKDPHVKAVFVNIFGGIMRCDIIANGIIAAARQLALKIPVVVRLEGTNVEQGKALLSNSGLKLYSSSDMTEGAKKEVALTQSA